MTAVARIDNPREDGPAVVHGDVLARAQRGDDSAWRQLVADLAPRIFAFARRRCRSEEHAEEITQAVFVKMVAALGSGGYEEVGRFEAWVFTITRNLIKDDARRRRTRGDHAGTETLVGIGTHDPEHDDGQMATLSRAVGRLDDADRETIQLRHHAGLSFKQIAEVLGEPMGTVLARHHRALKKLRRMLDEDEH